MKALTTFLSTIILSLVISCSDAPKSDGLAALRKKAEKSICDDVRNLTYSSVDAMSLGIGSLVMKSALTESEQDSMIMKPFLPVLRKELKTMKKDELNAICKEKTARYKFIGSVLIKNKDSITASVQETYEFAAPMIGKAIEISQQLAEQAAQSSTEQKP